MDDKCESESHPRTKAPLYEKVLSCGRATERRGILKNRFCHNNIERVEERAMCPSPINALDRSKW